MQLNIFIFQMLHIVFSQNILRFILHINLICLITKLINFSERQTHVIFKPLKILLYIIALFLVYLRNSVGPERTSNFHLYFLIVFFCGFWIIVIWFSSILRPGLSIHC